MIVNSLKQRPFCADTTNKDAQGQYRDPLMKWPLRGAAFTNEIGEGLRPLIGSSANLFWAPVFLYIGADIYDKYKNDGKEHSPNSRRLIKQACFQGLASITLPLVAIKAGQNIFSLFGLLNKSKITYSAEENIANLAKTFVANGNMRAYHNKEAECTEKFKDIVKNNLEFRKNKNFITKSLSKIQKMLNINPEQNLQNYAENIIRDLIEARKSMLNPSDEFKNNKLYTNFIKALEAGETKSVATKSVLTKMLDSKMLNSKIIKTIGGFIAVGFAINPIDKFVENVVIDKFLGPKIDNFRK